ncbi:hypothetical protein [Cardinium endosymbiont of Culicoides punctatus]
MHGRTPLAQAVHGGHVKIIELLLNHGPIRKVLQQ